MTGPGDRVRWSDGDLASQPTVALPIVPPAQPELATAPVVESEAPPPPVEDIDESTGAVARRKL